MSKEEKKEANENIHVENIEAVKDVELGYIASRRAKAREESGRKTDAFLRATLTETDPSKRGLVGLAFSGGGIRSASFNLGVMQALSKYGILPWVDYLSTVSGGGYIGAALISMLGWRKDAAEQTSTGDPFHFNTQWENFPFNPGKEIIKNKIETEGEPAPESSVFVSREEGTGTLKDGFNRPLRYLIEKGNFLTPRGGYMTRDILRFIGQLVSGIFTMLSLYLLLIFIVGLGGYLMVSSIPELAQNIGGVSRLCVYEEKIDEAGAVVSNKTGCETLGYKNVIEREELWKTILTAGEIEKLGGVWGSFYVYLLMVGAGFAMLITGSMIWINRPYLSGEKGEDPYAKTLVRTAQRGGLWLAVFVALSVLLSLKYIRLHSYSQEVIAWMVFTTAILVWALVYWAGIATGRLSRRWLKYSLEKDNILDDHVITFFSILFVWTMLLAFGFYRTTDLFTRPPQYHFHLFLLPVVMIVGSFLGVFVTRLGSEIQFTKKIPDDSGKFTSWSSPRFRSVFSSWLGILIYALLLSIGFALLMIPQFFVSPSGSVKSVVPVSSALISSVWAAVMLYLRSGSEKKSGGGIQKLFNMPEEVWQGLLGILVIVLNYSLLFIVETKVFEGMAGVKGWEIWCWFFVALGVFVLLTWMLNPNEISPHYFYRDRIDDAFLRTETFATDGRRLVARDHSRLKMQEINPEHCSAPYHLVIGAINLSGSWALEFKDSQSDHFLFSKYFTGSDVTGYVNTRKYRTGETVSQQADGTSKIEVSGITKYSRAVAISGAAFSSSLGVVSFLAATFLLTILNIRLGLWMVNPKKYTGFKDGDDIPDMLKRYELHHLGSGVFFFFTPWWLIYLMDEASNRVSERRDLVNLSDGGHTGDNAALYPLFQRRCKLIIAGDASADPTGDCVDLYRVIRMARTDLGVEVEINTDDLKPGKPDKDTHLSAKHVVIGKITYPETQTYKKEIGWLVYIKPTITKDDRGEIRQYYDTHQNWYPHPTTGDQWFDEWQFEAQRLLGEESVERALADWLKVLKPKSRVEQHPLKLTRKIFWNDKKSKQVFNKNLDRVFNKLHK